MSTTPSFATPEGLRFLLLRLEYGGQRGWRDDFEAVELMTFAMEKYGALARKYGLEPTDAAAAAFDVMGTRAARIADDPWAVVTHAVHLSLVYEARARGLLCSTHQARRTSGTNFHDAERFSDRESDLADYHPALQVEDNLSEIEDPEPAKTEEERINAYVALDRVVQLFVELGWPEPAARLALEYIAARLIRTGSRRAAFESLRRDEQARAMLDIDQEAWLTALHAVLGHHHPDLVLTSAGRGIFKRFVRGECLEEAHADKALADAIRAAAPKPTIAGGCHV